MLFRAPAFLLVVIVFLLSETVHARSADPVLVQAFNDVIAEREASVVAPYLALSQDRERWFAHAACDDDGDNVIVISHALVALVNDLAHTANNLDELAAYRQLLQRNPAAHHAALPPPAQFFATSQKSAEASTRARAMFAYLFSTELARFEKRTVVCASPDRTREAGDATWSREEQRFLDHYVASEPSLIGADAALLARVRKVSPAFEGARDLLSFFAEIGPNSTGDALANATLSCARERLSNLEPKKDVRMQPLAR